MATNPKFKPSTAKLCKAKKDNKVFSLYFSNSVRPQATFTLTKVRGKWDFEIEAQNTATEGDKVLLTAFVYKDNPKWNNILSWCVQEGLLTEDEAQEEMN